MTCTVRWAFLHHVVWNRQNIKPIFVEISSFVCRTQASSASTLHNDFRQVCHPVVALYLGSDFAHLETLRASHAEDHILRLLAEWIERVILLQVDLDASRTDELTFGLLPCGCSTVEWCSPWILYFTATGLSTILRGKIGDWNVLLNNPSPDFRITTFSMHTAESVVKDDRFGSCLIELQFLSLSNLKVHQYTLF